MVLVVNVNSLILLRMCLSVCIYICLYMLWGWVKWRGGGCPPRVKRKKK